MEKFTPFEKLSKKKQREINAKKRGDWNGLNPVTRNAENPKAYQRQKAQKWSYDSSSVPFLFACNINRPSQQKPCGPVLPGLRMEEGNQN